MSLNKIMLIGNLGRDPELRYTQKQTPVCTLSIATTEKQKGQDGNWTDHTEWHRIVVFGKQAENCANYLKKGRQVFVEGKIRTNKWTDKNGIDRYTTEVWADNIRFLSGGNAEAGSYQAKAAVGSDIAEPSGPSVFDNMTTADDLGSSAKADEPAAIQDDDIPF